MRFFWMLFAWWRGATYGTLLTTWLTGVPVGTDEYGNRYYRSKDGKRRWVLYNGTVEASRVPGSGTAGCITLSRSRRAGPPRLNLGKKTICPI